MINLEEKTKVKTDPDELTPYLDAGYPMLPLHHWEDKTVLKDGKILERGKTPLDKEWTRKTFDSEEMLRHMRRGNNVGVQLRKTDLIIDVDPRNDTRKENEPSSLQRFLQDVGLDEADDIPRVETGGGGLHFYFTKPENLAVVGKLDAYPGIEFKTYGQQVVAAGSIHPKTGKLYKWDPLDCDLMRTPKAPQKLLEMIEKKPNATALVPAAGLFTEEETETIMTNLDVMKFHHNYDNWLRLMMACHHASGGAAKDVFVSWSLGDPEYAEDEEIIRRKWDSLKICPEGKAITFKTLRYFLKEGGQEHILQQLLAKKDFDDFDVNNEVIALLAAEGCVDKLVEEMNKVHALVPIEGKTVILTDDYEPSLDEPSKSYLSKEAFKDTYRNKKVPIEIDGKRVFKSCAEIWLDHKNRRDYTGVFFDPGKPKEYKRKLNLWNGWQVKPVPGDWSLIRDHIVHVLCNGNMEHAEYILKWTAFMLQKPAISPEVALVFRGQEGTGKGTFCRILMMFAGPAGASPASVQRYLGQFNGHMQDYVLLFADESLWGGDKASVGPLKQLITEGTIQFEGKFKSQKKGRNFIHLVMTSNESWIVPAGETARRFCVLDVSDERRGDKAYFTALYHQIENGGREAMFYDLMKMDISGWHPSHDVPQTKALAQQKLEGLDFSDKWWMSKLVAGRLYLPLNNSGIAADEEWQTKPITITPEEKEFLREDFENFLVRNRQPAMKATQTSLRKSGQKFGLLPNRIDGKNRGWILPPLDEMRAKFEEWIKYPGCFEES